MMRTYWQITLITLMLLFSSAADASAVTIVTRFVGGAAPVNAVGGGNLTDIMNAAASIWESAYSDPITVTLYYGWAPVGDAGIHNLMQQWGYPNREVSGTILFDSSGSVPFYLDPTPYANEEYRRRTEEFQDLGGGFINVARIYVNPTGAAAGHVDLLSVALHEIGHAMGLSAINVSFIAQSTSGIIDISEDLPFAGTVVPLAYNSSGVVPHFDVTEIAYGSVMGGINGDERRIPSELDIITNAQISSFTIQNLYPRQTSQSVQTGTSGSSTSQIFGTGIKINGKKNPLGPNNRLRILLR